MAIRQILRYPHEALNMRAEEWRFDGTMTDGSLAVVIEDLSDTLLNAENGAALAANQIGSQFRLFAVKNHERLGLPVAVVINPKWLPVQVRKISDDEGCLSFPGVALRVSRFEAIKATFQGVFGEPYEVMLGGFAARVFQHETEHLDGHTFLESQRNMVQKEVLALMTRKV